MVEIALLLGLRLRHTLVLSRRLLVSQPPTRHSPTAGLFSLWSITPCRCRPSPRPFPPPTTPHDPVSLRRLRADAIRANAAKLDDALADPLDLLPRAKAAISAQVLRDHRGRRLPDPELAPLDLEPIRAILESHGLGDAISPGSPDAATVEREVSKLRAQIAATRDRALAELARGTPRPGLAA
jgi:hypothetical protein